MVLNTFLRSLTLVYNLDSSRQSLLVRTTWPRGRGGGGLLNKLLIGEAPSRGLYIPFLTEEVPVSYYLLLTNGISFTYLVYNFAALFKHRLI